MWRNDVSDIGALAFAEALRKCKRYIKIELWGNERISPAGEQALQESSRFLRDKLGVTPELERALHDSSIPHYRDEL